MASEELRKKWGTIFMGEREATVEQLDAMQEPMRREQLKREQQENYLDRVRAKAAERAREILGAAYAERQKVLEEAKAEAEAERQKLVREGEALKAAGTAAHEQAAAELAKAEAEREEAERIREAAHGEGFQAGMEQAEAELKEFRAELGQSLAVVLRAVDAQREAICDSWRGELAELVRTAVAAGTGWLLDKEHDAVLHSLVLEALSLLEDRGTVTVRVNPEDEATVGDMFMIARERAPELKQWIVNGDAAVERGGLVAESVSGSVDCRREHFRELVDGILVHLALPVREGEEASASAVHELVEREVEKIAALAPEPEHPVEAAPDLTPETEPGIASEILEAELLPADGAVPVSDEEPGMPLEAEAAPDPSAEEATRQAAPPPVESFVPEEAPTPSSAPAAGKVQAETGPPSPLAEKNVPEESIPEEDMPQAWLPPLGEKAPEAAPPPAVVRESESGADGYAARNWRKSFFPWKMRTNAKCLPAAAFCPARATNRLGE